MAKEKLNIDDLLAALKNPSEHAEANGTLANTRETWALIGDRDWGTIAGKIGLDESEVNDFIKSWVEDNPYHNIVA